ncbi:putative quinol monooxygenase [Mucilaginibacter sp.]|jgi:quinol monooxygenase YgiN|uniref:putative quinol monooxygenase n=1 Tax=Mucilaginibacter sp. TaxID=1882438 RepID=UPI003563174C
MKTNNKVTLTLELDILPGYEKEVFAAAEKIYTETRKERGCELFVFNKLKESETTILFFEVFTSQEFFDIHLSANYTTNFISAVKGKVVGDGPKLTFLNQFEN